MSRVHHFGEHLTRVLCGGENATHGYVVTATQFVKTLLGEAREEL